MHMALSTPSELVFPCKGLCTRVSRETAILEVRPTNLWVRGCVSRLSLRSSCGAGDESVRYGERELSDADEES